MQAPPKWQIDAWPKPNYVNPKTRGNAKIILNVVLYSVLVCFLSLRIFTRTYLRKIFGPDDILILLALLPTTAFFVISVLADTKFNWTRHSYDIPLDQISTGLKMVLITEVVFALACTLTKLSMLMFVRRILNSASLLWRRITLLAILIVSVQGIVFCFTVIFQCRPIKASFQVTKDRNPNCIDDTSSLLVAGIINTFTDFMVVLLPIRTVWCLQLPTRQNSFGSASIRTSLPSRKMLPIVLLFAFGFLSCFAGIARTYYTYQISRTWDKIWASYPVWVTGALELYIGIICASIPATKPFFSALLPRIFGSPSLPTTQSYLYPTSRSGHSHSHSLHSQPGHSSDHQMTAFDRALKINIESNSTIGKGNEDGKGNAQGLGKGRGGMGDRGKARPESGTLGVYAAGMAAGEPKDKATGWQTMPSAVAKGKKGIGAMGFGT
ncbi:hypothetical protein BJ875DRAFT_384378 [Amylocarpus encephaloides]|uniref:Rhodopsin domain-containing protein n=1 Tax=Amylocarpus encephaloides TaxID=45428 RepID=A0A9P8C1Y1_9HELO|nr:hypothetical protein BJ875DRAFT_384378 [Amylocarpus encephaloides]